MSLVSILFYFFATVLVVSAAMVVTIRNPVKAALFLVLSFFRAAFTGFLIVTTMAADTANTVAKK